MPEPDAPIKPAAGYVVDHGDAVGGIHGMLQGEHGSAGVQHSLVGQSKGLGDQQLGHWGVSMSRSPNRDASKGQRLQGVRKAGSNNERQRQRLISGLSV
jgi:hypothetical protein